MIPTIQGRSASLPPSSRLREALALVGIAVFGSVALLPQCLPNDWFFLDIPTIMGYFPFTRVLPLPNPGSGRHLAFFELFHGFAQFAFGPSPRSFFLLQSLFILAAVSFLLWRLRRVPNAVGFIPLFLLALFPCSAADLYATVGKSETIAIVFFLSAVAIVLRPNSYRFAFNAVLAGTATILLQWTKETAPVLVLFFLVYNLAMTVLPSTERTARLPDWGLSIGSLLGLIIAKIITSALTPPSALAASYVTYEISSDLIRQNLEQYWVSSPSLFVMASLALISFGLSWQCRTPIRFRALSAACLGAGFAYFLGLLLWKWSQAYYISIPEIFFALAAIVPLSSISSESRLARIARRVSVGLFIYTGLVNLGNFHYFSAAQRAVAHSYSFAVEAAAKELANPATSTQRKLFLANFPTAHEATYQTALLLRRHYRLKNTVEGSEMAPLGLRPVPVNLRAPRPDFHRDDLVIVLKQSILGLPYQRMRCVSTIATPEPIESLFPVPAFTPVASIESPDDLLSFPLFGGISINAVNSGATLYRCTSN